MIYFEKASTPYLVSAKADVNTLKSRYGVTTFGDLTDLRITLEIIHDRRHGELLRIKPTPPPSLPSTSESELAGAEPDQPET